MAVGREQLHRNAPKNILLGHLRDEHERYRVLRSNLDLEKDSFEVKANTEENIQYQLYQHYQESN